MSWKLRVVLYKVRSSSVFCMTALFMFLLLHKTGPVSVPQCWTTDSTDWLSVNLSGACEHSREQCWVQFRVRAWPEAILGERDGRDCTKGGVLHLAWSAKVVLPGFTPSAITCTQTACSLGFMKWRNHSGWLQYSVCIFQALTNEKPFTQYHNYA